MLLLIEEKIPDSNHKRTYIIYVCVREKFDRKKNSSFLRNWLLLRVLRIPDTKGRWRSTVHVFVSPGPQLPAELQLHACNDTRAQRGAQESGRGFGM